MNNLHKNQRGGGDFYLTPEIEVYSTVVEVGFSGSLVYGEEAGTAGSDLDDNNQGGF